MTPRPRPQFGKNLPWHNTPYLRKSSLCIWVLHPHLILLDPFPLLVPNALPLNLFVRHKPLHLRPLDFVLPVLFAVLV